MASTRSASARGGEKRVRKPKPPPESYDPKYLSHDFDVVDRSDHYRVWLLERIRDAKLAQLEGRLSVSAPLARALMGCPAVHTALLNRIAPSAGIDREFVIARGDDEREAKERVRLEAASTFGPDSQLQAILPDVTKSLAMLGIRWGQLIWTPRADGSRVDVTVQLVPAHATDWNARTQTWQCRTTDGLVDMHHGDGKWCAWQLCEEAPWEWGALAPVAIPSADRAYGARDRSQNSHTQGQSKMVGYLPQGIMPKSPAGKDFEGSIKRMQREGLSGMIAPFGAKVERVESDSQAWQIFRELMKGDAEDIAKVLIGQDGSVSNSGGNYMKAEWLEGVRDDIVERDVKGKERGCYSGIWRPWTAMNFGVADWAPRLEWLMPDFDQDARRKSLTERTTAFHAALEAYKKNGFIVDDPFVEKLAKTYGIEVPKLAAAASKGPEIFQYDLEMGVVTINEARERKGLPRREGYDLTKPELDALAAKRASSVVEEEQREDAAEGDEPDDQNAEPRPSSPSSNDE